MYLEVGDPSRSEKDQDSRGCHQPTIKSQQYRLPLTDQAPYLDEAYDKNKVKMLSMKIWTCLLVQRLSL